MSAHADPHETVTTAMLPPGAPFSGLVRVSPGRGWRLVTTVVAPAAEGCVVAWWWERIHCALTRDGHVRLPIYRRGRCVGKRRVDQGPGDEMKRWGPKHTEHAKIRGVDLFARAPDVRCLGSWISVLRKAGLSPARVNEEVQLVRDLVDGRVVRQVWFVAISDTGHACGPTLESVAGDDDGEVEQVIRYRPVECAPQERDGVKVR